MLRPQLTRHLAGVVLLIVAASAWMAFVGAGERNRPQRFTLNFERGDELPADAEARLHLVQAALLQNPDYAAVITGHSGTLGDPAANLALSERRAAALKAALVGLGIDPARLAAVGVGGADPLPQRDGEGERSYQKRLSRANLLLRVP